MFGAAKVIGIEDEIKAAVELASSVDNVILVVSTNGEWESESFDRKDIKYPGHQDELISRVLDANPNAIVVNQSGTPVEMPWISKAKAVVHAWFGGNELGNAIADVLYCQSIW